jgi:hypothetical protein
MCYQEKDFLPILKSLRIGKICRVMQINWQRGNLAEISSPLSDFSKKKNKS